MVLLLNMDDENKYITPDKASKLLKVAKQTLVNWSNDGKIEYIRTKGGHRRYFIPDLIKEEHAAKSAFPTKLRRKICYCRVSTHSQKEDLERQIEYFRSKFPDYEVIRDIGSGINFKRKGFNTILDYGIKGEIEELVVTHKDRLCRFGFELIERIISNCSNGKIMVLDSRKTSPQEELVNDLITIITVFSSRIYGWRSHTIKKAIADIKDESTTVEDIKDEDIS